MVSSDKKPTLWRRILQSFQFQEGPAQIGPSAMPININAQPIGSSGTQSYGGYPSEDYLHTLRGKARADVFDHMRRADAQVKMCLSSVKNPIKSANFDIEPADDSDEAKQDADLIRHILFDDMDHSWLDFMSEALTLVDFGHSVFEVIHKVVLDHKKFGAYNGIKCLAFRSQRTIERWNLDPATGGLISLTQYAYGDLDRMVDIPADQLLLFALDKEGSNYEGISALRPCYGPWFRKNTYLKLNAIGIEKFAVPTPIVEYPTEKNDSQYNKMIAVLEHYLTHQKNYLIHPTGWKLTLNTNTYDPQKVEVSIDNEDKRMTKAFLANFLELGMGSTGSYALSNDLSDFFLGGLDHIATLIEGPINRSLIPQLIQMNRGQREAYPTLTHSGISDKAGKELAECLKFLSDSKVIVPDNMLEEHIRRRFKFPKISTEGQRQVTSPGGFSPTGTLSERIRLAEAKRKVLLDC